MNFSPKYLIEFCVKAAKSTVLPFLKNKNIVTGRSRVLSKNVSTGGFVSFGIILLVAIAIIGLIFIIK